jgi:hypothetical protein
MVGKRPDNEVRWNPPSAGAGGAEPERSPVRSSNGAGRIGILILAVALLLVGVTAVVYLMDDGDENNEVASDSESPTSEATSGDDQSDGSPTGQDGANPESEQSPSPDLTPTAEPSPTPEPTEASPVDSSTPRSDCYEPRPDEDEHDLELLPAEETSMFQQCQLIAYYGFPGETNMGIAGEYEPEEMIRRLNEQVDEYEEHNGFRTAIPALELIFSVAQATQTEDGTYLARMSSQMVEEWIGIADEHDLMLLFDIQLGSSTVEAEVEHLLPYLEHPRVHLGIDPEFVTTPDTPPGLTIGTLDASEINRAQEMVKEVVDEHDLPNKIVMVHQFIPEMISNKEQIEVVPGIDLVIHQDGFGVPEDKIANYDRFVAAENAKHGGFKVFYKQDQPVMTPEQLMNLIPQPDVITYQ